MQNEQPPKSGLQSTVGDNSGDAAGSSASPRRLFALQEYDWAFFRFVRTAVDHLIVAKNPVLTRIKAAPSSEIHTSRNTTDSGDVVETEPIRATLEIVVNFNDVVSGRLEAVTAAIDSAAERGVEEIVPQVAGHMGRVIDAFGTRVNLKGVPLDHAAVRRMVEASAIEFDEEGKPDLEPWVFATPDLQHATTLQEMIRRLPPRTPEEAQAWDEMIEHKRAEFNAKRRRRTLY